MTYHLRITDAFGNSIRLAGEYETEILAMVDAKRLGGFSAYKYKNFKAVPTNKNPDRCSFPKMD